MPASRGLILDRHGHVLAANKNAYKALISLKDFKNHQSLLKDTLSLDPDLISDILENYKGYGQTPFPLKEDLTWQELAALELLITDIPDLLIQRSENRYYPEKNLMAHALGYVSAPREKDLKDNKLYKLPGIKIGKQGLEKSQNPHLLGLGGVHHIEVDARGRKVRTIQNIKSQQGAPLKTTISLPLQKNVHSLLKNHRSACALVMNAETGEVLSLISHPSYDPNLFVNGISHKNWNALLKDPFYPLMNKVTSGLYSPGSAFKMIVGLAGLKSGAITPHSTNFCEGHKTYYGRRFHCWNWRTGGHGSVNLYKSIKSSCDIYFYDLAKKIGIKGISEMATLFELGDKTGIEIEEKSGLVPTPEWKKKTKKRSWLPGDTINTSIGQGYLLTTPIAITRMMAALVNGGYLVTPHLTHGSEEAPLKKLDIPQQHLNLVKKAMDDVVNTHGGTAYNSRHHDPKLRFGGKTGSTQVSSITLKERELNTHNNKAYHLKEHSIFSGYVSKYCFTVLVEHGGGGAKTAAPIAKKIVSALSEIFPKDF